MPFISQNVVQTPDYVQQCVQIFQALLEDYPLVLPRTHKRWLYERVVWASHKQIAALKESVAGI